MKLLLEIFAASGAVYFLCLHLPLSALAQPIPSSPPIPEDQLLDTPFPENFPDAPLEQPATDPPVTPRPSLPAPASPEIDPNRQFRIGTIELVGVTLSPAELNQLTADVGGEPTTVEERLAALEGQIVTLDDLLALRTFIGDAYVKAGYLTSGAFLPQQTFLDGGNVQIQVVEGDLEALQITGLTRLREAYVRDRIFARIRRPLRNSDIAEALQLLQLDPLIATVDAELLVGSGPGLSILTLDIVEVPPLSGGLSINNHRPPLLGSVQLAPSLDYANLLGLGDRLALGYSLTPGLNSYTLDYTIPITPQDGTFTFRYATSNSRIVDDAFEALGIRSDSRSFSISVQQPLVRTTTQTFEVGAAFDLRRSRTFIFDDIPFSFAPGAEAGESRVSVIRFFQDWVDRSQSRVLAARSQFSIGIDAFNATQNDSAPDGQFFSWLGQFQWAQRMPKNSLLVTRVSAQLTPDSLLSLEQFSQGGLTTIRGYAENELVTDNGVIGSLELRLPLSANPNELVLTPFVEGGVGWNTGKPSQGLASVGLGLQWQIDHNTRLRIDYGRPLIEVDTSGDSLQEEGLYLSIDWAFGG